MDPHTIRFLRHTFGHDRPPDWCQVTDNIYIGDLNAAVTVAVGETRVPEGEIVAVFNISAIESAGYTLAPGYAAHGIGYETAADKETHMTLLDGDHDQSEEEVASLITGFRGEYSVIEHADGNNDYYYPESFMHPSIFLYFMHIASMKIATLITRYVHHPGQFVLVHCIMGRNRSASAIVAHLIRNLRQSPGPTVAHVRTVINNARPRANALTNTMYIRMLTHYVRPGRSSYLNAFELYDEYCVELTELLRRVSPPSPPPPSSVGGSARRCKYICGEKE